MAAAMLTGCASNATISGGNPGPDPVPIETETPSAFVPSSNVTNMTEGAELIPVNFDENEINGEWVSAISGSSLNILAGVSEAEGAGKNILLSPTSVIMAFGMCENGACGETLAQMESVIGGGVTIDQMNPILYAMSERFENAEDVKWNVANSIWFNDDGDWSVVPEFASEVKTYYGADIWGAPFDDTTVEDINNWVNHETYGMIDSIINEISQDARMYLINALAFEGEWKNEYEDSDIIENYTFTNFDGSTTDVTMLCSNEGRYFTLGDGTGFTRDYKGGEYSFFAILPEEGLSVEDYIAQVAAGNESFSEAVTNQEYFDGDIIVMIPEFENDYNIELSHVLSDLGMEIPFDMYQADFGDMMTCNVPGDSYTWINKVLHKTHIEVDREGTRAAAVTAIEMDCACEAIDVREEMFIILDRPFVYGIVDNATGLPVFMGYMNTMN